MLNRQILFLKATIKKEILIPGYTRADGTFVSPHHKVVNVDPDVDMHSVIAGKGSFSQKQAHKKLSKLPHFAGLSPEEQHAHILSSAQNIQTSASKGAQISVFKKQMLAGQTPKPANMAAFKELMATSPNKGTAIIDEIVAKIGKDEFGKLWGAASGAPAPKGSAKPAPTSAPAPEPVGPHFGEQHPGKVFSNGAVNDPPLFKFVDGHWQKKWDAESDWIAVNKPENIANLNDGKDFYGNQLVAIPEIDWEKYKLDASNTNAASHNKKIDQIKAAHQAGSLVALFAMKFGSNTYGKKQAKLRDVAVAHLEQFGSPPTSTGVVGGGVEAESAISHPPDGSGVEVAEPHFGKKNEDVVFKGSGESTKYRFKGKNWFWSNNGTVWKKVTTATFIEKLNQGLSPQNGKLIASSLGTFGKDNVGKIFDAGSYQFKYEAGDWKTKLSSSSDWFPVTNGDWIDGLNNGVTPTGIQLAPQAEEKEPQPDSALWSFTPDDPGFSGSPSLIAGDHYIVYVEPFGDDPPMWEVGVIDPEDHEAGVKQYQAADRVFSYLQSLGVHPPEVQDIKNLALGLGPGDSSTEPEASPSPSSSPAASVPAGTETWTLTNTTEGHNKFWTISLDPEKLVVTKTWGKIGTAGQSKSYPFVTLKNAQGALKKWKDEKLGGGYTVEDMTFATGGISSEPVEDGPKEGSMKPGKDGLLILKDGHWQKMSHADVIAQFPCPEKLLGFRQSHENMMAIVEAAKTEPSALKLFKKVKGTKMGGPRLNLTITNPNGGEIKAKAFVKFEDGKWVPFGTDTKSKLFVCNAANYMDALKAALDAQAKGKGATVLGIINGYSDGSASYGSEFPAPPPPPSVYTTASAPKISSVVPSTVGSQGESIDGWQKIGNQSGYNPGGTYKDSSGEEWYCKFPAGGAKVVRNELLANKLYAAAGTHVPDVKLVTQNGQLGIASRILKGAVASKDILMDGKADGLLSGFVADAWLANWDVVGNNPAAGKGWDNIMFKDGKAYRIDPGGSMLFGGAGGEKNTFGNEVIEIETMRDEKINSRTASVFGKMSKADMSASAVKVLSISDAAIAEMVNQFGPGDAAMKTDLTNKLIARKAYIAAKFPQAAKKVGPLAAKAPIQTNVSNEDKGAAASGSMKAEKKIVFKPEELAAPPDFLNWSGPGKHGPATLEAKNIANQEGVNKLLEVAKKGSIDAVKAITFPIYDGNGDVSGHKTALEHPSQYVRGYAQQLINEIDYQLNPPKVFRFKSDSEIGGLSGAFPAVKNIATSTKKLGKYVLLGETDGFPETEVNSFPKLTFKSGKITTNTFASQSADAWAKIPKLQKDAVKSYCGYGYHNINSGLWSGNPSGSALSAAAALHTHGYELPAGLILSRKISLSGSVLADLVGKELAVGNSVPHGTIGSGATGKVLQEPAVGSTSISPGVWSGNVHLKMIVGPGVKGLYTGTSTGISPHQGEKEMLLPPNTRMLVKRVMRSPKGGDADGFGEHSDFIVEVLILPTEGA